MCIAHKTYIQSMAENKLYQKKKTKTKTKHYMEKEPSIFSHQQNCVLPYHLAYLEASRRF
jgi:TfoX/Sxy family transcriptional regulator of competence genes